MRSSARRSLSTGPGGTEARMSRSRSRSRKPGREEQYEQERWDELDRTRVSTIPAAAEEDEEDAREFDPRVDTEFRTPQELAAAERRTPQLEKSIRPSTSRIPLAKSPSVPLPQDVVDRDSPLPRSRHGSGAYNGSGNWDDMQYARRARSNSIGSQVLLDDGENATPPRPGSAHGEYSSPQKAKVPSKTPTSGARKASAANGTGRARSGSMKNGTNPPNNTNGSASRTTSAAQRPVSRGNHKSRPSTSGHAPPEGEPPWLAGMYKPDPRLPPDQQIIPTHAKRMRQEAWANEESRGGRGGRSDGPTVFDREGRPLNEEGWPVNPGSYSTRHGGAGGGAEWPLPSPNATSPGAAASEKEVARHPSPPLSLTPSRPGTSGGYKITPTIVNSPPQQTGIQKAGSPPLQQGQGQGQQGLGIHATATGPGADVEKAGMAGGDAGSGKSRKKGCGCCVVM